MHTGWDAWRQQNRSSPTLDKIIFGEIRITEGVRAFGLKLMFAIACGGDDSADAPAAEKEVSEGMKKESVHEDAKKNWHY